MNYTQKYYKEIFLSALQSALEQGLISHENEFMDYIKNKQDISNFYVMLLSVHSEVFEKIYDDMALVYNSSKIQYANDNDLDDIGEYFNCPRPVATKAGVDITFTLNRAFDSDIHESSGLLVSTDTGIVYETVEELYFPAGTVECTVHAYATETGVRGKVVENQLNKLISKLSNVSAVVSCTNIECSNGGSEAYTDNEYRELLSNWVKTKQKGNEWAYRDYFVRQNGINDCSLIPNWDGSGTIKIIVDPGDNYTLNKVYNELKSDVIELDEDIVLMAPVDKTIDVYVTCNVDIDRLNPYSDNEKTVIGSKIHTSIIDYINSLKIGEDFIPHKLATYVDIHIPELKNIVFTYPTEPVTVFSEEQCSVGTIEITME